MKIPKKRIRGLKDIRTHSGRDGRTDSMYKIYSRLSFLEMEKVRLMNEQQSTLNRLHDIDARLAEIEEEEAELSQIVGQPQAPPVERSIPGPEPDSGRKRGLRLRY